MHESFAEHLLTINNIRFTQREIDIITCLLSGKSGKVIASYLDISPKTVEAHTRNIMLKLECNSKEGIINFVEKSDKFSQIKNHYLQLLNEIFFKQCLQKIASFIENRTTIYFLTLWCKKEEELLQIQTLKKYLKLARIEVIELTEEHITNDRLENLELNDSNKVFYILPQELINHLQIEELEKEIIQSVKRIHITPNMLTLLVLNKKQTSSLSKLTSNFEYINFAIDGDPFFTVFEIIKRTFPTKNLNEIIAEFERDHKRIRNEPFTEVPILTNLILPCEDSVLESNQKEIKVLYRIIEVIKENWIHIAYIFSFLFISLISLTLFKNKNTTTQIFLPSPTYLSSTKQEPILSDLVIPTKSFLLQRPELLAQIENQLNKQNGIQSIALVGAGGAGKTTLARQYAHSQKANVIWEINAETKENLDSSFENLAEALAQTEESKKILREIHSLKNLTEKEEKIIQFVKEKLRSLSNWILIFDNAEKFSDIQKYFPHDLKTWGSGKVILTTRDINIENNAHVSNTIQIGELTPLQKFTLFTKILDHENAHIITQAHKEETKAFLERLPPFPLDISIAAYYLKVAKISYQTYLENLVQYNKDFADVQESLLKEAGNYTKTRYGIITLSLGHILNTHKDFQDLLLFISLLDSQDIPRDLLDLYKTSTIIDNFLYTLKKYSLITKSSSSFRILTFSIHRSTQAITLAYLVKLMGLEKNKNFIEQIGTHFKNYAAKMTDKGDFHDMDLLIRHCEVFLSHSSLLTDFVIGSISCELGYIYRDIGNYEKAKQLLEQSIAIYQKNSFENHSCYARSLQFLGNLHRDIGNYEKAKQLLKQSLTIYQKNSYENHHWFARSLQLLGNVYKDLGDYKKAKELFEQSIAIYQKNSYENHHWFALSLSCLGNVYRDLGDYKKAKDLFEQSIVIYQKNSFENHHWFAWTLSCLGNVYRDLGDYKKAKELFEQSIAIYQENPFENHPWFALCLGCLGNVYRDLGDYKKAKELLQRTFQIHEKIYQKNHINTASVIMNLGLVSMSENDIEEAENLIIMALKIFQNNKHPKIYTCFENLSDLYLKKAQLIKKTDLDKSNNFKKQAISYLKQAFEIVETYFSKDSHHTLRIQNKLHQLNSNDN